MLCNAFQKMEPTLRQQLAEWRITFHFNPPHAPHLGGVWEREIKSIKASLRVVLGSKPIPETVLCTVIIEVEGTLNTKPLGYISADPAHPGLIALNMLVMVDMTFHFFNNVRTHQLYWHPQMAPQSTLRRPFLVTINLRLLTRFIVTGKMEEGYHQHGCWTNRSDH